MTFIYILIAYILIAIASFIWLNRKSESYDETNVYFFAAAFWPVSIILSIIAIIDMRDSDIDF